MSSSEPKRRGRPPGSPNKKPKLDPGLSPVERKILHHTEQVVDAIVKQALKGDVNAAKYLIDRVLGKPTERVSVQQQTEQRIVVEYPDDWRQA